MSFGFLELKVLLGAKYSLILVVVLRPVPLLLFFLVDVAVVQVAY